MGDDLKNDGDLNLIVPEAARAPDDISHKEELNLKGQKATTHSEWKHRQTLEKIILKLETSHSVIEQECSRLRRIEVDHQRFITSNRYLRLAAFIVSTIIILGGCLISQFGAAVDLEGRLKLGIAWGMVITGLVIQLFFALFDPRGHA